MRLNKDQREGLAKISDNLTTAFVIAVVLAGWVDDKMGPKHLTLLLLLSPVFVTVSLYLRRGSSDGN